MATPSEFFAFAAALRENPGDATTIAVAADFIEESGCTLDAARFHYVPSGISRSSYVAADLRRVAAAVRVAWPQWEAFYGRLLELRDAMDAFGDVNVIARLEPTSGYLTQKNRAALARQLLADLGLKGCRVACATGSMCFWVNIRHPARLDVHYLPDIDPNCDDDAGRIEAFRPVHESYREVDAILRRVLYAAFPSYIDRSDLMTDYHNDPWSISYRDRSDYEPKVRKEKVAIG